MTKTTKTRLRCSCGKIMSQYATACNKCDREAREAFYAAARATVATGQCPTCGSRLRRNSSMTGWFQCEQYGAVTRRARPNDPPCNWQTCTE